MNKIIALILFAASIAYAGTELRQQSFSNTKTDVDAKSLSTPGSLTASSATITNGASISGVFNSNGPSNLIGVTTVRSSMTVLANLGINQGVQPSLDFSVGGTQVGAIKPVSSNFIFGSVTSIPVDIYTADTKRFSIKETGDLVQFSSSNFIGPSTSQSSVTILGTGFDVMHSSLVVASDGKVGVGINPPAVAAFHINDPNSTVPFVLFSTAPSSGLVNTGQRIGFISYGVASSNEINFSGGPGHGISLTPNNFSTSGGYLYIDKSGAVLLSTTTQGGDQQALTIARADGGDQLVQFGTSGSNGRPQIKFRNTSTGKEVYLGLEDPANGGLRIVDSGGSNIIWKVLNGGGMMVYSRTKAQLNAITPGSVGETYFCSDCSPAKIVVSTGGSAANFADAAGGPFK